MSDENLPSVTLGNQTIEYLSDLASESFKRQVDLDESVWRSLPFFAATFAFVAAVIGRSALDAPALKPSAIPWIANGLLAVAVCSLAWSLRWFWVVLRPREYEYPAPDALVRAYAEDVAAFHRESGVKAGELDARTLTDMRLFMIDQYGSAAATNLEHNAVKLKARPKVLLFMLLGFVLAFACEATIFMQNHLGGHSVASGVITDGATSKSIGKQGQAGRSIVDTTQAQTAQNTAREGRGGVLGR